MLRSWMLLVMLVVILGLLSPAQSLVRRRKRPNKQRPKENMADQLNNLKKNVTALEAQIKGMQGSKVNVAVYGIGEDHADMDQDNEGTHVHIHMHMEHDDHDSEHGHHDEHMHFPDENEYVYGHCHMQMNPTLKNSPHKIHGAINLRQKMHGPLEVMFHLNGFHVPEGGHDDHSHHTHALHVHQYGDFSNGCGSFGGHFNPDNHVHSAKHADERHAGDWGNISCDEAGMLHTNTSDTLTSLIGSHSILGRGIVIHEHADDLGTGGHKSSLKTGNAGGRLACCIVAWSKERDWEADDLHEDVGHEGGAGHVHEHHDH